MVAAPKGEKWTVRPLGALGKWLSGGTPSMADGSLWGGGIPWVSPKDMKVARLWDAIDHVTDKALGNGTRLAPKHAIFMVVRGMILAHSFPVARAERALAFNQDIKALVTRDDVDSEFVLWWLQAHEAEMLAITTESTHGTKRMASEILYAARVAVPPLEEQRAIAAALSDIDAMADALDRLLAKKGDLKQAAMQQLLTARQRLPGFSAEWKALPLGVLGATYGGLIGKAKADFGNGSAKYVTFMGIMRDAVLRPEAFESVDVRPGERQNQVQKGDLFFNGSSETPEEVGMCSVLLTPVHNVYVNSFCFGFRLRQGAEADGLFLAYLFRSDRGRELVYSLAQGAIRYNISKASLLNLRIQLPTKSEQIAIAAVLSDMDAEIRALEQRLAKMRALKQGMMQELLTGSTRLV